MANVLNMDIVTLEKEEGPAMGAAILAAVGCGEYNNVYEAAEKIVRSSKIYSPDVETVKRYDTKYKKFIEIYPTVKHIFNKI